jgi:allantoicase
MGNLLSKNRYTRLEAVAIDETAFECYTEVSSAARNAEVESVTDEAFGKASNLLEPKNPKANSIELSNQGN